MPSLSRMLLDMGDGLRRPAGEGHVAICCCCLLCVLGFRRKLGVLPGGGRRPGLPFSALLHNHFYSVRPPITRCFPCLLVPFPDQIHFFFFVICNQNKEGGEKKKIAFCGAGRAPSRRPVFGSRGKQRSTGVSRAVGGFGPGLTAAE